MTNEMSDRKTLGFIAQTRDIPVVGEYDVVVCGGGPGGIMAALAAAKGGARTAIIERYGFLGGMPTAGLVAPISVFNYNGRRIIDGLPWQFVERLMEVGGAEEEKPLGNITFSPEKYKLIAQRMLLEEGVTLYLHSYISGCKTDSDNRITHVIFENKNGAEALAAKYFIDATGDADLSAMAHVPMQPAGTPQPPSLIFMLGNVDTDALPMIHHSRQGVNYHDLDIRRILTEISEKEDVPVFGGPWYCGILAKGLVLINMTRTQVDMLDNRQATHAECLLREHVNTFTDLLRRHVPAFKEATLVCTAPQAGVRETRRIKGVHTLTADEYLNMVNFHDSISRGCHPVDIHASASTAQRCEFLKDAAFIPYRSLIAPGFPNLIMASRSFSADAVASASVRVQASVMGIGQAAGAAAALCINEGNRAVNEIDTDHLRKILMDYGTNLTN